MWQRDKRGALASEPKDNADALMEWAAHSLAVVFDLASMRRDFHRRDYEKHGRREQR